MRRLIEGSETQVVISFILLVTTNIINRNRWIHQVNMWLSGWCNQKKIDAFDHILLKIWSTDTFQSRNMELEIHPSQRGSRILAQELAVVDRASN